MDDAAFAHWDPVDRARLAEIFAEWAALAPQLNEETALFKIEEDFGFGEPETSGLSMLRGNADGLRRRAELEVRFAALHDELADLMERNAQPE